METAVITTTPDEIARQLRAYKALPKEQRTPERQMVARAYRWAKKGHALISLRKTMRDCGVDDRGRPLLAFCRADARYCHLRQSTRADFPHRMWHQPINWTYGQRYATQFPSTFWPLAARHSDSGHKALVPSIPAEHLPTDSIANYQILFEAEWEPEPPVDPMLLKHLGGDIYAVVAHWDLTEVERAVLAGRLNRN